MAEKCLVSQCCCGCSLRSGALGTGIFCLVTGLLALLSAIYGLITAKDEMKWFDVIVYIIGIVLAITLIIGVKKERVTLIKIWVYVEIVLVILAIIGSVVLFVLGEHWISLVVVLIGTAISSYLIVVVRSYAVQLESSGGGGGNII